MKYLKLFVLSVLLSASSAYARPAWRVGLDGPIYSTVNKNQYKSIKNLDFEFMDYFTPTVITKSVYDQLNNKFRGRLDLNDAAELRSLLLDQLGGNYDPLLQYHTPTILKN